MSRAWLSVSRRGGVHLVRLAGEVDTANAPVIERELRVQLPLPSAVVIDLTAVSFLDSAGVRMIDTVVADLAGRGASTGLVVPEGGVRLTLRLCAFPDELIHPDLASGIAAVGN